jgi:hypothetical protein
MAICTFDSACECRAGWRLPGFDKRYLLFIRQNICFAYDYAWTKDPRSKYSSLGPFTNGSSPGDFKHDQSVRGPGSQRVLRTPVRFF